MLMMLLWWCLWCCYDDAYDVVANIDDVVAYIDDVAAYADDGCYYLLFFSIYFDDSYIYILPLICELTPSAGIAALWASAGNED